MKQLWILVLATLVASVGSGCDDDESKENEQLACLTDVGCTTRDLPFSDSSDAPTLTDVALECQSGSVVLLATATDPQGTANLSSVQQTVDVFSTSDCEAPVISLQDDLAGSGLEESFGDVVLRADDADLYDDICACNFWPVQVLFVDANGNSTAGRVRARVID